MRPSLTGLESCRTGQPPGSSPCARRRCRSSPAPRWWPPIIGDAQTGLPLHGALVSIPELEVRTLTDENGRFVLFGIPRGEHHWVFRMLGYADWEQDLELDNLEHIRVGLLVRPIVLENITVTADRLAQRRKAMAVSVRALTWDEINATVATNVAEVITRRSPVPFRTCPQNAPQSVGRDVTDSPYSAEGVIGSAAEEMCVLWRGSLVRPTIYLDNQTFPTPIDVLTTFAPEEIHTIEFYDFGVNVRVYTVAFIQSGKPLLPPAMMSRRSVRWR